MPYIEYTHPGTPSRDDPQVQRAMGVWGNLDDRERSEVFRTLYRMVLAHQRTGDADHLVRFAESVRSMVELESTTDLRERIRKLSAEPPRPAGISFEEMARRLCAPAGGSDAV